jgi:aldose 1-epimerase
MIAIILAGVLAAAAPSFTATVEPDAATGWNVIVLKHADRGDPDLSIEARIAPEAGGNLFSFKVGGDELLDHPEKLADLARHGGMPVLFPTPNRVRDAVMTFQGQTFHFKANDRTNFIHGLVKTRPWQQARPPRADGHEAVAALVLDWDERQPEWSAFPIKHRLTVTYTVEAGGLRIGYRVHNLDRRLLPYGFGLHPYFRILGARKDVTITVPLDQRMEAVNLLPTGTLLPVAGTPYDLRRPTPLEGLALDDVYFGLTPARRARIHYQSAGLEVTLAASREFTHLVVFTPPRRPIFALEDQTCSTDAHNLWSQGKKAESHLLVLAPGASGHGQVTWSLKRAGSVE